METKIGLLYLGSSEGVGDYTYELALSLSKLTNVVVYISSRNPLREKYSDLPCKVSVVKTYEKSLVSVIVSMIHAKGINSLLNEIKNDEPTVIIDTMPSFWQGRLRLATSKLGIKWGVVVHDVKPHPDRWSLLTKLKRFVFKNEGDFFITLSDFSSKAFRRLYPERALIESRHGAYKKKERGSVEEIKHRVVSNRNKFIFFGRIERYKGIEILLEAFDKAKKKQPDLQLSIVGKGPLEKRWKKLIDDNGVNLINYWISDEEMIGLFDSHGCVVLPYLSATQSGPAAICQGRGLPCIVTDVGALPEQVKDNYSGVVVPSNNSTILADALMKVSKSERMLRDMSTGAIELGDGLYSFDVIAKDLKIQLGDLV